MTDTFTAREEDSTTTLTVRRVNGGVGIDIDGGEDLREALGATLSNADADRLGEWLLAKLADEDVPMVEEDGVFWALHENGLSISFEFRGDDGEVEISGLHSFEGCVNWSTSDECMHHFCGLEDAVELVVKFGTVARIAQREIVRYDEGCREKWPGAPSSEAAKRA